MYNLAERYYQNKNYAQAFEMYIQASKFGYYPAYYNLGMLYERSEGVEKDLVKVF
jgi:TPR repeat protein